MSGKFKVVIVGGGIGGLALANMLERFDVDYVVLEARDEIVSKEGAAIGLMPNGSFILEQLGIFDAVRAAAPNSEIRDSHVRNTEGKSIMYLKHMLYHQEMRHGYPMLFFDRRLFLEVLYGQLTRKDRIVTSGPVSHLEVFDDSVKVTTRGGKSYVGDIVIGADGIHSTIRRELFKTGRLPNPADQDNVPCYYQCSFGIAQDVEGWPQSEQCFTAGRGKSFLIVSGPNGRCYWFLFVKYPKPLYGRDIPRYTTEDEAKFVEENSHLTVREGLKFGQVYAKRITSGLTPLHEIVFKQWFSDRVLLIGDAVHKPNPIGGMGANAAIETATELVNALMDAKAKRGGTLDGLSPDEIKTVFSHVQDTRHQRAEFTIAASHELQALVAMENPWLAKVALNVLLPLAGKHNFFRELSGRIVGASRLKHLPVPSRRRAIPYDHELPAKPLDGSIVPGITRALFCAAAAYLVYSAAVVSQSDSQTHTPKVANINTYLGMLSPLLIYNIEGSRIGRHGSLVGLPLLFALAAASSLGVGRSSLLYALVYMLHSPQITVDRPVPVSFARSLLPSVIIIIILVLLGLVAGGARFDDDNNWQTAAAPPILLYILPLLLSQVLKRFVVGNGPDVDDEEKHEEWYSTDDLPALNMLYGVVALAQASVYLVTNNYNYFSHIQYKSNNNNNNHWLEAGAALQALYLVWELRRQGYTSTRTALTQLAALAVGCAVVGPSASLLAVYCWRENVVAALSVGRVFGAVRAMKGC
ncbi:FAD/NAD(P)-binding domain-containing protein [Xylariaceae sp. FL0594]|nr:FAD/NAD(P)-binding domain-containing protein [Xylariaceae sp. FL0594]